MRRALLLPTLWEHDAPWLAINDPDQKQHIFHVRGPVGIGENGRVTVFKMASTLGGDTERSPLTRLFYGDPVTHPGKAAAVGLTGAEMTGFSRYYATRDQSEAQTAVNVLDAGGTKDLCSVWLVGWGPQSVCMASADGQPSDKSALCVMDWRYVVRIANVDAVRRPERVLEMTTRAMYGYRRWVATCGRCFTYEPRRPERAERQRFEDPRRRQDAR